MTYMERTGENVYLSPQVTAQLPSPELCSATEAGQAVGVGRDALAKGRGARLMLVGWAEGSPDDGLAGVQCRQGSARGVPVLSCFHHLTAVLLLISPCALPGCLGQVLLTLEFCFFFKHRMLLFSPLPVSWEGID